VADGTPLGPKDAWASSSCSRVIDYADAIGAVGRALPDSRNQPAA
jgi:hypothetical protein